MRRVMIAAVMAAITVIALPAGSAHAQFKPMGDPKIPLTGRTEEGLKADAEIDKSYRAKAGQRTPEVKTDPWADVRTPPAQPSGKAKQ